MCGDDTRDQGRHERREQRGWRRAEWDGRGEEWQRARRERRRQRKERILHTRISEDLAEDIRRVAEELRVPVSNLVRNVLDEAFSAVEIVSENVGDLVEDIVDEAEHAQRRLRRRRHRRRRHRRHGQGGAVESEQDDEAAGPEDAAEAPAGFAAPGTDTDSAAETDSEEGQSEFADVVGWQPVLLHREKACAGCERALRRGKRAFLGITAAGAPGPALCRRCMNERA